MKLLVVALLAGCNAFYGLDDTQTRDAFVQFADEDQDGVANERDNCSTIANAPQIDSDADGIGDACDACEACPPCATGPNHDEDGDHIADGCDPCPALGASDGDGDGDGIGDACEIGTASQRRVFFDGFQTATAEWLERGSRWDVANDVVTVKSGFDTGTFEYHRPTVTVGGTAWFVETTVHQTDDLNQAAGILMRTTNPGPPGPDRRCWLVRSSGTTFRLISTDGFGPDFSGPASGIVKLRLSSENPVGATHRLSCEAVGLAAVLTSDESASNYPLELMLYSDHRDVAFEYVDVATP